MNNTELAMLNELQRFWDRLVMTAEITETDLCEVILESSFDDVRRFIEKVTGRKVALSLNEPNTWVFN